MWIWISLIIIIVFVIVFISMAKKGRNQLQEYKDKLKDEGLEIILADEFIYLGGYEEIGECNNCTMTIYNNKISLSFSGVSLEGSFKVVKDIDYKDLISVDCKTQTQIQETPSLAKVCLFGIWGFAMKGKTKELSQSCLVINTTENSIIIKPKGSVLDIASEINKARNKFINQE